MNIRSVVIPFLALGIAFTQGCASRQKSSVPSPEQWLVEKNVSDLREAEAYRNIKRLYSLREYDRAIDAIRKFQRDYPQSVLLAHVDNFHGLCFYLKGQPDQAIIHFKRAIERSEREDFKQYALFNLGASQYESGQYPQAAVTFTQIDPFILEPRTRYKFHFLSHEIATKRRNDTNIIESALDAAQFLEEGVPNPVEKKKAFAYLEASLKATLDRFTQFLELKRIYEEHGESPLADHVIYLLGKKALDQSRTADAEDYLRSLVTQYPKSSYYQKSMDLLKVLRDTEDAEGRTIGVLLPLSGRFAKFGQDTLNGIELAFRIFNTREPDSRVTLMIEDSGETAESTIEALERLVYSKRVVAVIGPLLSKGIEEVTERAQELRVPLISLTQQAGADGDYVFYSYVTPEIQARAIARYAIQERGMRRFAILHPDNRFGSAYSESFWDSVEEFGGTITGVEAYPPKETDFRQYIDKLSGMHYLDARRREEEELVLLREKDGITKKTRENKAYFELSPVVDYDAVFISDDAKLVSQILPTFAFRDVTDVRFLGTATWNSPLLPERAGRWAQGAWFVDVFYPGSQDPRVRNFVNRFKETYSREPTLLSATSFDAASILEQALLRGQGTRSRSDIKNALISTDSYPGVTGTITYQNGRFERNLKVLTFKGRQVVEVERNGVASRTTRDTLPIKRAQSVRN